jgi:hypothetical protein
MSFPPPSVVPRFVLAILNAAVAELRAVAERRPGDARLESAVSSIDAAIRSLGDPQ